MSPGWVKQEPFNKQILTGMVEYRLVVDPDAMVQQTILAEKKHLFHQFGLELNLAKKAHITVADFFAREEMEETLIRWIQRICSRHQSFRVTLNNYGGFPSHTIYLRVQDPEPFQQLAQQLKMMDDFITLEMSARPYLGIASKLPGVIFDKAMVYYAQKLFHESFEANTLILLKKGFGAGTSKTINIFHFLPDGHQPQERVA